MCTNHGWPHLIQCFPILSNTNRQIFAVEQHVQCTLKKFQFSHNFRIIELVVFYKNIFYIKSFFKNIYSKKSLTSVSIKLPFVNTYALFKNIFSTNLECFVRIILRIAEYLQNVVQNQLVRIRPPSERGVQRLLRLNSDAAVRRGTQSDKQL